MERIYQNRGIVLRMRLAMVFIAAVATLAAWILVSDVPAEQAARGEAGNPLLVGGVLLAIAALGVIRFGHYGLKTVTAADFDRQSGALRLHLWRPAGEETIDTHADDIGEWGYEVSRKNTRMPIRRLRARLKNPPRWILFELSALAPPDPDFRRLAPEAIADYERDIGVAE